VSARYEFIAGQEGRYPRSRMFVWAGVSSSGFYEWRGRAASATARRRAELKEVIAAVFDDSEATYGYRRVHAVLARSGIPAGPELVRQLMREMGLEPCQPRPFRPTTTIAGDAGAVPDLVGRDFTATVPGSKLVGDITYSAQRLVMCRWGEVSPSAWVIACRVTAHNQRSCRKARSRSPGWNRVVTGLGSPSFCRTASLAARSASRY